MRCPSFVTSVALSVIFVSGCGLFLRAGRVESRPNGVAAIFPQQDGWMQADNSWTKNMIPIFEIPATGTSATVVIRLSPHVTALSNHLPTYCDTMVLGTDDIHGISLPVTYEPAGSEETFRGTIAIAELAALPDDKTLSLTLCAQRYVFNARAVHAAIDARVAGP